jgi:parallel beta-helix repeat protein
MKTKLIGIIICMLLVGTVLPVSGTLILDTTASSNISDDTLYVGGSGEGNYTTIQEAINDAVDGDTVFVYAYSSPYYENVVVNKSIFLIGEDKDTTIIDGYENGNVVYVTADGVTISGFTIMNSKVDYFPLYAGVFIYANYTEISFNIIKNNFDGIAIDNLDYKGYLNGNVISDNIISSNSLAGIDLSHCKYSTVTNNIVLNNNFSAIHTNFAINNLISGNEISNNYNGLSLYQYSDSNEVSGNNITNNQRYCIFLYDSGKNKILQNNFIESGKRNVKLLYYIWNLKRNKWNGNYWDEPKSSPYLIFGKISIWSIFGIIPWFEIDWNPAQEPYDI